MHDFKSQLLLAVGHRIELYGWGGPAAGPKALVKTAFFDLPYMASSVALVKDYVLTADVHASLYFLRYVRAEHTAHSTKHAGPGRAEPGGAASARARACAI